MIIIAPDLIRALRTPRTWSLHCLSSCLCKSPLMISTKASEGYEHSSIKGIADIDRYKFDFRPLPTLRVRLPQENALQYDCYKHKPSCGLRSSFPMERGAQQRPAFGDYPQSLYDIIHPFAHSSCRRTTVRLATTTPPTRRYLPLCHSPGVVREYGWNPFALVCRG